MKKYKIGDIVFVANYTYKEGINGQKHLFVIIDDGQAVDLEYYGFLLSSKLNKRTYPYNEILHKNNTNNLLKDSIVKCDDLIQFSENEIEFKIGSVPITDLNRFLKAFNEYLSSV